MIKVKSERETGRKVFRVRMVIYSCWTGVSVPLVRVGLPLCLLLTDDRSLDPLYVHVRRSERRKGHEREEKKKIVRL